MQNIAFSCKIFPSFKMHLVNGGRPSPTPFLDPPLQTLCVPWNACDLILAFYWIYYRLAEQADIVASLFYRMMKATCHLEETSFCLRSKLIFLFFLSVWDYLHVAHTVQSNWENTMRFFRHIWTVSAVTRVNYIAFLCTNYADISTLNTNAEWAC